jgi:hypothetical protein
MGEALSVSGRQFSGGWVKDGTTRENGLENL